MRFRSPEFIPAAAARVGKLIFAVQPELVRLLAKSLPGVDVVPWPKVFPLADAWCAIASLPTVLGLTTAEIRDCPGLPTPRLTPPGGWALPGRRFRIGICWAGSPGNDIDKWRSLASPAPFLTLYQVPGVELYSFQVGDRAKQLHEIGAVGLIRDLSPWIRDVADAAAILSQMDLVITVETFLGHLAGHLGLPCWVLYSYNGGDWRLSTPSTGSLWYPAHRVLQQDPDADWRRVWRRVVEQLTIKVEDWTDERNRAAAD